ncbi:MAG TPA: META domain-containing protein [Longimicrobium sp.]|nr:META domain-containing protein [Longimicrobium sp.]
MRLGDRWVRGLAAAGMMMIASACAPPASLEPGMGPQGAQVPLEETTWGLEEIASEPVRQDIRWERPTLRLVAAEGRAQGTTGCNSFGGGYQRIGDRLVFGELVTTRRFCEGVMETEQAYLQLLDATDRYSIDDGRLTLYAGDRVLARFRPAPSA